MPRIAATTVLIAVLMLATSCADTSSDPGAEATRDGSSATHPSSEGSPTDRLSSTVQPATGVRLTMPHATVRGPNGWVKAEDLVSTLTGVNDPRSSSIIDLGDIEAFGGTPSLSELAETSIDSGGYLHDPKKLPPIELDGVKVYHVAGWIQRSTFIEEFGAIVDDRIVTLTFQFDDDVKRADRKQIVASVLPTFHWK